MKMVALIPARAGSKRVPGKNTRMLGDKPLLAWTIEAAHEARMRMRIFSDVIVSSDDSAAMEIAETYRACSHERKPEHATDEAPDLWWVRDVITSWPRPFDAFAILRPTSPFRTGETIRRAYAAFVTGRCSSLRAVEPVTQHPGKMWQVRGKAMEPLLTAWPGACGELDEHAGSGPWHSHPTQTLPKVYVQNASLEMAWTWCVSHFNSISGPNVAPFFTEGDEGFDINTEADWQRAEQIMASRQVSA